MGKHVKGYSLLEIILVTSFIIIFIVVINPGTYIDRFSRLLLKMSVLQEADLMINKFNSLSLVPCVPQSLGGHSFGYSLDGALFSFQFDQNQLVVNNLSSNVEAMLYQHVDSSKINEFSYFNHFLTETLNPSSVVLVHYQLNSSLIDSTLVGSFICNSQSIVLGEF
tara:strand:- start:3799 stop:4296 length:498 start_codon:yes stop_codon:yes gene_type:complete